MGSYETAIIIPVDDCWLRVGVNIFNVQSSVSTSRCTISTSATWTPSMGWRMITSRSPTRYSASRSSRRQRASQTATFASAGSRFRPKIRWVQAVDKRTSLAMLLLLYSWFTDWLRQTSVVQQRLACFFFHCLVTSAYLAVSSGYGMSRRCEGVDKDVMFCKKVIAFNIGHGRSCNCASQYWFRVLRTGSQDKIGFPIHRAIQLPNSSLNIYLLFDRTYHKTRASRQQNMI